MMDGIDGFLSRMTRLPLRSLYSSLVRPFAGTARTSGNQNPLPDDMIRALRDEFRRFRTAMEGNLRFIIWMLEAQSVRLAAQADALDAQSKQLQEHPGNFRGNAIKILTNAECMLMNLDRELQEANVIKKA